MHTAPPASSQVSKDVCGVIVTFHPETDAFEHLSAARRQLEALVVIDNGSPEAALDPLRRASRELDFTLIENGRNLGLARALNQGVNWAQQQGTAWVMFFDQDSAVTDAYVASMLACAVSANEVAPLAILVPRYIDRRFGTVLAPPLRQNALEAATTSGSLMPLAVFSRAGLFAEELFIDGIDYEYSLRVRRIGYQIRECPAAELLHAPGTPAYHTLLGKRFQTANYSPVRRYYQERNKIWVARRYLLLFPSFCIRQFATSLKDLIKIILVEPDKARKCRFFFLGIRDGVLGRTGALQNS